MAAKAKKASKHAKKWKDVQQKCETKYNCLIKNAQIYFFQKLFQGLQLYESI